MENVAIPNYDECKSLTFTKKNRRAYEHVCDRMLGDYYMCKLFSQYASIPMLLEVFLIFDEV